MPVNVTKQLVTLPVVDNEHVVALREPAVVPGVKVKVTGPVGELDAVVVSTTVAVTLAEQLDPPRAMLQVTSGTEVVVESFPVAVTVIVAAVLMLVL